MALSKDEVIKIATGFLDLVRKRHGVRQAYLFGSFSKGTAKAAGNSISGYGSSIAECRIQNPVRMKKSIACPLLIANC